MLENEIPRRNAEANSYAEQVDLARDEPASASDAPLVDKALAGLREKQPRKLRLPAGNPS